MLWPVICCCKRSRRQPGRGGGLTSAVRVCAVLQRCLERWGHEVDRQVRELKRQMAEIDARIENMFDEPGLRQVGPPRRRGGHRAGVMGPLGRPSLPRPASASG